MYQKPNKAYTECKLIIDTFNSSFISCLINKFTTIFD